MYVHTIDHNLCILCGKCQAECPRGCIKTGKDGYPVADMDTCVGCGRCAYECPAYAITITKEDNSAVENGTPPCVVCDFKMPCANCDYKIAREVVIPKLRELLAGQGAQLEAFKEVYIGYDGAEHCIKALRGYYKDDKCPIVDSTIAKLKKIMDEELL